MRGLGQGFVRISSLFMAQRISIVFIRCDASPEVENSCS